MSKLNLPLNPTLKDFQKYINEMVIERGFDNESLQEAFVLFAEEVGEMARVVRKTTGVKVDETAEHRHAEEELADLLMYIFHMANILKIDLEQAFRDKEEKNKKRIWV